MRTQQCVMHVCRYAYTAVYDARRWWVCVHSKLWRSENNCEVGSFRPCYFTTFNIFKDYFYCMCSGVLTACTAHCTTGMWCPQRPAEGIRSLCNWQYRWTWATMGMLGIKPRTFRRAAGALKPWVISPASPSRFGGFWGSNSGCQACLQPYCIYKPYCQPLVLSVDFFF
jgi:hypothetical protein